MVERDVAFVAGHVTDLAYDAVRAHRLSPSCPPVTIAFGVDSDAPDTFVVDVGAQDGGTNAVLKVPVEADGKAAALDADTLPPPCPTMGAFTLELSGAASRVPRARRFVVALLYALGHEAVASSAEIVVSELVTNTVVHTEGPATVGVAVEDGHVRVDVCDTSTAAPTRHADDVLEGRGLVMVDALATRWGHTMLDGGKCVWAEFDPRGG